MLNYTEMTVSELEQERERLEEELRKSRDTGEIEMLTEEIEGIEDILSERDLMTEE